MRNAARNRAKRKAHSREKGKADATREPEELLQRFGLSAAPDELMALLDRYPDLERGCGACR